MPCLCLPMLSYVLRCGSQRTHRSASFLFACAVSADATVSPYSATIFACGICIVGQKIIVTQGRRTHVNKCEKHACRSTASPQAFGRVRCNAYEVARLVPEQVGRCIKLQQLSFGKYHHFVRVDDAGEYTAGQGK